MRLIDTATLKLHQFLGADVPKYAILSHTWATQEAEVTFQDWLYAQRQNPPRWGWIYDEEEVGKLQAKSGYKKIQRACEQAQKDGFAWMWVDTNCIDKTSSAELSEAINSMYGWYGKAEVCYAFLADVSISRQEDCMQDGSEFRCSRWFSRGWTLQELIAPRCLVFFTDSWARIGDKQEMVKTIHEITTIPEPAILEPSYIRCGGIGHFNAATIISWASRRKTTLVEDMAYCLIGIFGVNMPLLYGEGDQAFLRLQLEIIQRRSDPTLLAWRSITATPTRADGMVQARFLDTFASEPACFSSCNNYHPTWTEYFSTHETRSSDEVSLKSVHTRNIRLDNTGLTLKFPLVETLLQSTRFAILPFLQQNRELWMPLIGGERHATRLRLPFSILSVAKTEYIPNATKLTLPTYGYDRHYIPPPEFNHRSISLSPRTRESHMSVLLTFPQGLQGYKATERFPPTYCSRLASSDIFLRLCVDNDQATIAFRAIAFQGPSRSAEHAVLFAVDLANRRCTCRDISWPRFEDQAQAFWRGDETDGLELRAHSQLGYLTEPSLDDLVVSTWEHRHYILGQNTSTTTSGVVTLDDRFHKASGDSAVSPQAEDDREDSAGSASSGQGDDEFIVSQIIFPYQKSD